MRNVSEITFREGGIIWIPSWLICTSSRLPLAGLGAFINEGFTGGIGFFY